VTNPFSVPSDSNPQSYDQFAPLALRNATNGDIIDKIGELERRIERLEAQLNTH